MSKIKAIVHDWDDTITNAYETYSRYYFDLGEFFGLVPPTQEGIRGSWGKTIVQIVNDQWPFLSNSEVERMVTEFRVSKARKTHYKAQVFPGAQALFSSLSKKFKLGILSSGHGPDIEKIYKAQIHNEIKYHLCIFAPPILTTHKPDPKVFDQVFEFFKFHNISEEETVYVGDNLADYFAARDRGLKFYAVTTGVTPKEVFTAEGLDANYIKKDFLDLSNELISNLGE